MTDDPEHQPPAPPADPQRQRRRTLARLAGIGLIIAIGVWADWFFIGQWSASTDNAYVGGNVVQVTPQVAGTVVGILVDDTDLVNAG